MGVLEDVDYWWQVWNQEHDYWRERERVARMARRQGQGMGMGKNVRGGGWF